MSAFCYSPDHDVNDGEPWSEEDIRDLENHIRQGALLRGNGRVPMPVRNCGSRGRKSERTWPDVSQNRFVTE